MCILGRELILATVLIIGVAVRKICLACYQLIDAGNSISRDEIELTTVIQVAVAICIPIHASDRSVVGIIARDDICGFKEQAFAVTELFAAPAWRAFVATVFRGDACRGDGGTHAIDESGGIIDILKHRILWRHRGSIHLMDYSDIRTGDDLFIKNEIFVCRIVEVAGGDKK